MFKQKQHIEISFFKRLTRISYLIIFFICIFSAILCTYYLQNYTKKLLRERLNERLIAIVSTAALQFSGDEIQEIRKLGLDAFGTPIYEKNIYQLQAIRSANKNIRYTYIIGKTDNPNQVIYIADADALEAEPKIDFNEDGMIDNQDISKPGDIYDATDAPVMRNEAFQYPSVDQDLTVDSWGTFLSAYAPIFDENDIVVGALTIDVNVDDYIVLINETFIPFLVFIIALLLLITFLTFFIVKTWKNRVKVVQDLDRQKDELLGLVSHQLATPVSAIKWNTEMMLDGDLGEFNVEQKKVLLSFQDITKELSDLISMILDVSRIQLGRIRVDKQELDLGTFFKEILDIIQPKVQEKKVKFVVDIPKNFPAAMLDKRYTHMTIENLLTNAVKYTPTKGQVSLKVSIKKNILHCEVEDTGVGIPKAEQAKIFGKLFRASNVKNSIDGNGFGLFVAKGAIEAQGGKIWFTSEEGKGSTFFIDLPLVEK